MMKSDDTGTFTYQTRLKLDEKSCEILEAYASLYGKIQRTLFADFSAGNDPIKLKNSYLKRFGITARQYNACRVQLLGKIDSYKKLLPLRAANLKDRIDSITKGIEKLVRKKDKKAELHQKKRRLAILMKRLEKLRSDQEAKTVRLCFGGKKMFRSQFRLEENGYHSHEEWKDAWNQRRNSEFFVLGSKDETAGNQTCVATIQEEALSLRLRLPDALSEYGKYLVIPNIAFRYGHDTILASLNSCLMRKCVVQKSDYGQAISYRFKKDKKGWILFATTHLQKPPLATRKELGAIGLDINANHLALVEIDHYGNPLDKQTIPLNTYGKTKNQSLAMIGDACTQIVAWAEKVKKPIILENLDFQKKKATLKEGRKKNARMLSSLAYSQIISTLKAKAYRHGVATHSVNPAFTSIIGQSKFTHRYGLTKHHAAALCIARRKYGYSEQPPKSSIIIHDGKESQFTLPLPARNRGRHVWTFWGQVGRKIRTALAAHFQAKSSRSSDPPLADPCDKTFLEVVGVVPAREPLATLLG